MNGARVCLAAVACRAIGTTTATATKRGLFDNLISVGAVLEVVGGIAALVNEAGPDHHDLGTILLGMAMVYGGTMFLLMTSHSRVLQQHWTRRLPKFLNVVLLLLMVPGLVVLAFIVLFLAVTLGGLLIAFVVGLLRD